MYVTKSVIDLSCDFYIEFRSWKIQVNLELRDDLLVRVFLFVAKKKFHFYIVSVFSFFDLFSPYLHLQNTLIRAVQTYESSILYPRFYASHFPFFIFLNRIVKLLSSRNSKYIVLNVSASVVSAIFPRVTL